MSKKQNKILNNIRGLVTESSIEEMKSILKERLENELNEFNNETKELLLDSTMKLIKLQNESTIEMGEILEYVFKSLSKQGSPEGVYEKWLSLNGVSKNTALRYRKKYILYSESNKNDIFKYLPIKYLNTVFENKETYIELAKEKCSLKEFISLLEEKDQKKIDMVEPMLEEISFDFKKYLNKKLVDKIENKNKKIQERIANYIGKIEKLLEE